MHVLKVQGFLITESLIVIILRKKKINRKKTWL